MHVYIYYTGTYNIICVLHAKNSKEIYSTCHVA